jgi:hypothetical protein
MELSLEKSKNDMQIFQQQLKNKSLQSISIDTEAAVIEHKEHNFLKVCKLKVALRLSASKRTSRPETTHGGEDFYER